MTAETSGDDPTSRTAADGSDAGDEDRDGDPVAGRGGLLAFLCETWIWILAPLVIALLTVLCLLIFSERHSQSPFLYDEF